MTVTREAIAGIARLAHRENTGARGLMTVLERTLRDFKFELPSTSIKAVEVSTATLTDPRQALNAILKRNRSAQRELLRAEVDKFADRFRTECGISLVFDDDAVDALVALSVASDKTIRALCEERFRNFEHGLQLVSRNTLRTAFTITRSTIDEPDKELSKWIRQSFPETAPPDQPRR